MTRNGSATNASAMIAPGVVNGRVMPKRRSSHWPTSPRRPKASSSATPPTTGGSTIGRVTSARTKFRPGNGTRASSQASGTPTSVEAATAPTEQTSDSRSAVNTAGSRRSVARLPQGVRTSSPASGIARNATASPASATKARGARPPPAPAPPVLFFPAVRWRRAVTARPSRGRGRQEPEALEHLLALGGADQIHERLGVLGVLAGSDDRNRVGGGHVLVLGDVDARDLALGCGHVGHVDDPGVGLAEGDLGDHGLDVILQRHR